MKVILHVLVFLCVSISGLAQPLKLFGTIVASDHSPISFANVLLFTSGDSLFYKGEVSNENGEFIFENISAGKYFIRVRFVGYSDYTSAEIEVKFPEDINLGIISLSESSSSLQTVDVVAERPFIEREADKVVVNVENSAILKSNSVLDLLEKLPGITIDQDGRIFMRGKQGIIFMIDGKPTPLAGQDLANFLRSMPASSVQKIELIANPPAKYDAAGNAGIIHMISKRNKAQGYNGSINMSYGQGRYAKASSGFSFNYSKSNWSVYLSYSYNYRKGFNHLEIDRRFYSGDTLTRIFNNDNYLSFPVQMHVPRVGIDNKISDRTTISTLISGISNPFSSKTISSSLVRDGSNINLGNYGFYSSTDEIFGDVEANLRLDHQLDTLGQNISLNFDYGNYFTNAKVDMSTIYSDYINAIQDTSTITMNQLGNLNLFSGKLDYIKPLPKEKTFEAGFKSSLVKSDQDMQYYHVNGTDQQLDSLRSSHFLYTENINAAYVNFRAKIKKLSIQAGLRAEQTIAQGKQILNGKEFERNYAQIFPTFYLNYEASEKHSWNINFGRRIDRPNYQSMNPMRQWIDANTYSEGNPYLLPQFTYLGELSYSYNNSFFASLSYNLTTDNILEVLIQDAATQTTNQTVVNIDQNHYYSLNLTYSNRITKWLRTNTNLLTYYSRYAGDVNQFTFNQGRPAFYFSSGQNFRLADGWNLECSINYNHKNLYAVTTMYTTWNFTVGIQAPVLKKKGNLTLNCSDVFWKAWPRGLTEFGSVVEKWGALRDTRVVNISFSYKFGKGQTGRMRRETGADDEKNRVR